MVEIGKEIIVAGIPYLPEKFLGKGKSGYSFIATHKNRRFVVKQIHHEPCPYYSFSHKLQSEINAYSALNYLGITLPKLIATDEEKEVLVKEYIQGKTGLELVVQNDVTDFTFNSLFQLSNVLKKSSLNIDYFPPNFVHNGHKLYYIDYECNQYDEQWSFEKWGIYYWLNSEGMRMYAEQGDSSGINISPNSGKPITEPFENRAKELITKFVKQI